MCSFFLPVVSGYTRGSVIETRVRSEGILSARFDFIRWLIGLKYFTIGIRTFEMVHDGAIYIHVHSSHVNNNRKSFRFKSHTGT